MIPICAAVNTGKWALRAEPRLEKPLPAAEKPMERSGVNALPYGIHWFGVLAVSPIWYKLAHDSSVGPHRGERR